jgi:hypothetical protein
MSIDHINDWKQIINVLEKRPDLPPGECLYTATICLDGCVGDGWFWTLNRYEENLDYLFVISSHSEKDQIESVHDTYYPMSLMKSLVRFIKGYDGDLITEVNGNAEPVVHSLLRLGFVKHGKFYILKKGE